MQNCVVGADHSDEHLLLFILPFKSLNAALIVQDCSITALGKVAKTNIDERT